jgi:hypothetical protein
MRTLRDRLTYANVMATLAVFIALGGTGYAAKKLDGDTIAKRSIPGTRLKKDALGNKEIKESKLKKVPSAARADNAKDAQTLNGQSAAQLADAAKLRCPAGTTLAAGACLEDTTRTPAVLLTAFLTCGDVNRRLPTEGELVAFGRQHNTVTPPPEWADLQYLDSDAGPGDPGTVPRGAFVQASTSSLSIGALSNGTPTAYRCAVAASN